MLETWVSKERLLSNSTPRFLADDEESREQTSSVRQCSRLLLVWNAVGKMPVRRDVLIMCVSAGKSVGEIAWRRCVGIGSRGHVVGEVWIHLLQRGDRRRRWEFEQPYTVKPLQMNCCGHAIH